MFDLACESCSAYLTADEIENNTDMPNQICDECLEAINKGEI